MKCPNCLHEPPAGSTFCNECGAKLVVACATCGAIPPPGSRFCNGCGATLDAEQRGVPEAAAASSSVVSTKADRAPRDYTPKHLADKILQSKSALEGERKQVTVLFADIQGSMTLSTQLDPEQWHELLERYFEILTDAVHRFEGTVNQYTGDGIMALFGAPIAHEDHAQRACYAALQARDQLRTFADELRLTHGLNFSFRIGLNSGDVVVGKIGDDLRMDYTAQGATVGIAQRIEQLAAPGHVYLGGETERLVTGYFQLRSMGKSDLKGLAQALPLYELEATSSALTRLDVAMTRGLSRFVGRSAEMQTLESALGRAQSGHGQVIGIVGDPGLGKSRLCFEFVEQCRRQGLPVFEAHCPAHGRNIPYLPILELFRNYFGIAGQDDARAVRQRIAGALVLLDPTLQESLPVLFEFMGVTDPALPPPRTDAEAKQRQLYDLIHRIVRAQDEQGQLTVTLIDDLHWVDAGSDGFVSQLVSAVAERRNLIVLNFRPEYVAAFATKAHYQQLPLVPLGDAALRELIADLIGRDESVIELTNSIIAWTTGNPFYTEELINALVDAGDLLGNAGRYRLVTALEHLVVPTNVRAVVAARIDRLPDAAKRLLQAAAVIGKEFGGPLLEAVTDLSASEHTAALERLTAGDFIYERALYPVFEYAFKHPLTHEIAYQSQLQSRRAVVHAAVARALEAAAGDKLDEQAALLAHHCEEAGEVLNAARWHRRAAEWVGRTDFVAAQRHWEQVRALLRDLQGDRETTELGIAACMGLLSLAYRVGIPHDEARVLLEEGQRHANAIGDRRTSITLPMVYSLALWGAGEVGMYVELAQKNQLASLEIDDIDIRTSAAMHLTTALYAAARFPEVIQLADDALAHFPRHSPAAEWVSGFNPYAPLSLWRASALCWHGRLSEGFEEFSRCRRIGEEDATPEIVCFTYFWGCEAYANAGDAEQALTAATQHAEMASGLGEVPYMFARTQLAFGFAHLLAGRTTEAIDCARAALEVHTRVEQTLAGMSATLLAEALLAAGDLSAAEAAATEAIARCRRTQRGNYEAIAHGVLARALLHRDGVAARTAVESELDHAAQLIERTGASSLAPFLLEWRAELAASLGDEITREQLLQQAEPTSLIAHS